VLLTVNFAILGSDHFDVVEVGHREGLLCLRPDGRAGGVGHDDNALRTISGGVAHAATAAIKTAVTSGRKSRIGSTATTATRAVAAVPFYAIATSATC
jgi:hypothetical protein